jgi:hypothetical protein
MYKKIFLICLLVFLSNSFVVCKDNQDANIIGIWNMYDTDKMFEFLKLKEKPKRDYFMQVLPGEKEVIVQFLYSKKTYKLKLKKIAKFSYKIFNKKGESRDIEISMRTTELSKSEKKVSLYWHFSDSHPYKHEKHNYNWDFYDGVKRDYKTLKEAVDVLQKEYEEMERISNTRDNE